MVLGEISSTSSLESAEKITLIYPGSNFLLSTQPLGLHSSDETQRRCLLLTITADMTKQLMVSQFQV
ncbi:hypothetical protein DP117_07430 [Brasilonema sp. UFV-L1]|nr:hypothetical protein [Brasilonema sp. UFV-L1]